MPDSRCITLMDPPSCEHLVSGRPAEPRLVPFEVIAKALEARCRVGVEGVDGAFGIFTVSEPAAILKPWNLSLV